MGAGERELEVSGPGSIAQWLCSLQQAWEASMGGGAGSPSADLFQHQLKLLGFPHF